MAGESDVFKEVLIALRQILRATDRQSKQIARETGLTTAQLVALQVIDATDSITAGELARALNLGQATVTAILTRLESLRLITRERAASDKRRVIVSLTAAGTSMLDDAPRMLQNLLEQRFRTLEHWEQMYILAALERLAGLMDARDPRAAPVLETGRLDRSS
ncbi:MAG: MarR family transcriptional regulator [Gammaproteobacteria bacterium]